MSVPSPTTPPRIVRVKDLPQMPGYQWISEGAVRHLIFKATPRKNSKGESVVTNGLFECGALTLAWFSPINPAHRNLRRASLTFEPPDDTLPLGRQEADWQQVRKGTVQHEILVGEEVSAFEDGTDLVIPVRCKSDAGELTDRIPYGIAVTLEVAEGIDIPVYQQVRDRIALRIRPETE